MKTISFYSSIDLPDGTSVSCTVTVPKSSATDDVMEHGEIAQSGANHAAAIIRRSAVRRTERTPF